MTGIWRPRSKRRTPSVSFWPASPAWPRPTAFTACNPSSSLWTVAGNVQTASSTCARAAAATSRRKGAGFAIPAACPGQVPEPSLSTRSTCHTHDRRSFIRYTNLKDMALGYFNKTNKHSRKQGSNPGMCEALCHPSTTVRNNFHSVHWISITTYLVLAAKNWAQGEGHFSWDSSSWQDRMATHILKAT